MKPQISWIPLLTLAVATLSTCSAAQATPSAADLVKQAQKLNNDGKQDEAIALYKQAVHLAPDNYEAYLGAGMAFDLKGDYAEARHHFEKAIELASGDDKDRVRRAMAVSYAFEGNGAEAAKYEQPVFDARMVKQDFDGAAEIANELARIYLESGDPDNAYAWYQRGYETALRKPSLKDADKNLWIFRWEHAQARIAARRGQHDEAEKHLVLAKAALDKANNPGQAIFYPYLTGYVAFYDNDYKTAIADLAQANQKDPFILVLMAQAYEKSGDRTQAMAYYSKVMAINSHSPTNAFARPIARKKVS
jgi:tetratricopeptide (TPR) repeat protein